MDDSAARNDHDRPGAPARELRRLVDERAARVGVIGLGYVGLPLAHAVHGAGFRVVGFDTDGDKVRDLAAGRAYLAHLGAELPAQLAASERFEATGDFERLAAMDVVIVCVPTPLGPHREPDLTYVLDTAREVGRGLRAGQLVVLSSTTYPGTTRDEFAPALLAGAAARGVTLEPGRDVFVAYSPERQDPGRRTHTTVTTPKVVGALDATSQDLAVRFFEACIDEVHPVERAEVAEASKLLENIFRSVNIALVNELKVILDRMDLDVRDVIAAASTKPFGFMPFEPGPGLGGHCIPIDPFYLAWKAKALGQPTRFVELAGEINTEMPEYVVDRLALALNERGRAVRGARVLVLGLAYKADVDDTRESPSFELIARLERLGAAVDYSDPHIPRAPVTRKHDLRRESAPLDAATIASYDAVLVATAHRAFDYPLLARHARLVVDTRGALRAFAAEMGDRLVRA